MIKWTGLAPWEFESPASHPQVVDPSFVCPMQQHISMQQHIKHARVHPESNQEEDEEEEGEEEDGSRSNSS